MVIGIVAAVSIVCLKRSKTTACPSDLIGVGKKCFYFSNDTGDWAASKRFCQSQGSELARVDTQTDMEFLKKHTGTAMHWIGLSRKLGEPWKWTDGSTFTDWFEIRGNGSFAFLNADGVHSSRGLVDIKWICSKPRYL
ncbi:C-type lectin domain family 2 member A [Ochotona curzoniae]|uniref:C-type lectin domain family 2 member A n=1 Tax=Ochotona curzoniae TaxID=130825 RepID=UPI001B352C7F|nr:C-type lectin domain family 2 member A [Ochotona curzoniae]